MMNKLIVSFMLAFSLSACIATDKNRQVLTPIQIQDQQLLETAKKFPKDTVALNQLAENRVKRFDKTDKLVDLDLAISTLEMLIERKPEHREALFQLYRLNLLKGYANNYYDIEHWQSFYHQHDFFKLLNLAPPEYMKYLLPSEKPLTPEQIEQVLKTSLKANPSFINGYLELAKFYQQQNKLQLAIFLLELAEQKLPKDIEITARLNDARLGYVYEHMCSEDVTPLVKKTFNGYKALTGLSPDNAQFHSNLSLVSRYLGKNTLSKFSAKKAAKLDASQQGNLIEAYFWANNLDDVRHRLENEAPNVMNVDDLYVLIFTHLVEQNWQEAMQLMPIYLSKEEVSFYGILYGAYAYQMAGKTDEFKDVLITAMPKVSLKPWQKEMLKFAQQEITEQELLAKSKNDCNATEAYFLLALDAQGKGNEKAFIKKLKALTNYNISIFYEHAAATNILKRKS